MQTSVWMVKGIIYVGLIVIDVDKLDEQNENLNI